MNDLESKSQKKRFADRMQKLGMALIDLSVENLYKIPMTDSLLEAIKDAKKIKSHGAKRRQAQLIGKIIRSENHDELLQAYNELKSEDSVASASFHETEVWRERLMTEKDALTAFISNYPNTDIQSLRQAIKKSISEREKGTNTGAYTALFRLIRATIS